MRMQVEGWSAPPFHLFPEGWAPCGFSLPPQSLLCAGGSGCWPLPWVKPGLPRLFHRKPKGAPAQVPSTLTFPIL